MTTKLAYRVSYTTEYSNGQIVHNDAHTRFFATRDQAVAHARSLTGAEDNNGVFVGDWIPNWMVPFLDDSEGEEPSDLRVTAVVETVTLDEIESAL